MMAAMKFSHDLSYDAAPEAVAGMLADPAFREKVCVAMHATRWDVAVDGSGAGMTVVIDQTQPARSIPAFAKKVVGDEIRIVQTETWTGPATASLELAIPGKPGGFEGQVVLGPSGAGTRETVTGEARVRIPLVGGKLESLVEELLRAALRTEERVGREWLAGNR
jgi:hypothetical protein